MKTELLKTLFGVSSLAFLNFAGDKLADLLVSILSEDGVTAREGFLLVFFLLLLFILFIGIQSVWNIIRIIWRRITGKDKISKLQERIRTMRKEILRSSKELQSTRDHFNKTVDSARRRVDSLNRRDRDFEGKKNVASSKILELKDVYQHNLSDLERLISQTCKDIDDAEKIFLESKQWSSDAASKFFK